MATTKSHVQRRPPKEEAEAAAAYFTDRWHPVPYAAALWLLLCVGTGVLRILTIILRMPSPVGWMPPLPSLLYAVSFSGAGWLAWHLVAKERRQRKEVAIARDRRVMLAEVGLPDPGDDVLAKQAEKDSERIEFVLESFETVCRTSSLQALKPGEEERTIPILAGARCTIDRDVTANLRTVGGNGITIRDIRANADRFAEVAGANRLRVRLTGQPGEARLTWVFSDPMDRLVRVQDLPEPTARGNAVIGLTEHGDGIELRSDRPGAWTGFQGSGKSTAIKAKLASLLHQGLYVELHIINPKKMEWRAYAVAAGYTVDDVEDVITRPSPEWVNQVKVASYAEIDKGEGLEVVEAYYARVKQQAGALAAAGVLNASRETVVGATPDNPYIWLINDEGGDYLKEEQVGSLHTYGLAKQKARATGAGFDACFIQLNESTLKEGRKLYANRIGFRSEEGTGIALFGRSAVERGAKLNEISENTPGVGYYNDPSTGELVRFKGALVTPADEARMHQGLPPEGMGAGRSDEEDVEDWYVYVLPDAAGDTPYVGMTGQDDPWNRVMQHEEDKPWFCEVDLSKVHIYRRDSEAQARKLEYLLIRKLRPFYNTQHNLDNPRRIDWKRDGYTPRGIGLAPDVLAEEATTRRWPRADMPKAKPRKVRQPAAVVQPVPLSELEPDGIVQDDGSLLVNLKANRYTRTRSAA